jgi:hypothetical protein
MNTRELYQKISDDIFYLKEELEYQTEWSTDQAYIKWKIAALQEIKNLFQ